MKMLPMPKGKQMYFEWNLRAWRRRAIVFAVCNLLAFIFLPAFFYGFWDTVGKLQANMARERYLYQIERKYGDTARTWVEAKEEWRGVARGINPANWLKKGG